MKVKVKITETYERVVSVKARNETEAVVNVTSKYFDGKRMLDKNGLVHFKVELHEKKAKEN